MANSSLYYFAKYIVGFKEMELEPHWEVCKFIEANVHRDSMVLLPRGTFKSSLISVALPLWLLTKNRDLRILITGQELENTKNFLGLIRQTIERNQVFRGLYGDWVSKDTWHQTALSLAGRTKYRAEDSITASSSTVSKVSQHYDMVIVDDLVTEKTVTNKEQIDRAMDYLQLLLPLLDPQAGGHRGPVFVVGTRWHFDDPYGRIIAKDDLLRRAGEPAAYHKLIRKAASRVTYTGNKFLLSGKLFFPSRFTEGYLNNIQRTMTSYQFSCQYLNDPLPDDTALFRLQDLCWFNSAERVVDRSISPMPTTLNFYSLMDPALSDAAKADYCAIITVAVDSDSNIYVWDIQHGRWDPDYQINRMLYVHETFHPIRFGVEGVAFQKLLIWAFNRITREKGKWFHVVQLETSTQQSKQMRIEGFQPFVRSRKVYLRLPSEISLALDPGTLYQSLDQGQEVLAAEMLRFPRETHDDTIDALSYAPQLMRPASPGQAPNKPKEGSWLALRARLRAQRDRGLLSLK